MTFLELITNITAIIQDSSYTSDMIKARINEVILQIATGVMIPDKYAKTPPLPDLFTSDTIDTESTGISALPATFNRDVIKVLNSNNESITIKESVRAFSKGIRELSAGSVYRCAVLGKRLIYMEVPTVAETLTVSFYEKPTVLVEDDDEPTYIPETLHRPLIISGVCKDIFDEIEDGIEDPKTNTRHHTGKFNSGLEELELEIGVDESPNYYEVYESDRI